MSQSISKIFIFFSMQFERNALNHTTNIITSQTPSFHHSTSNIDALKYNLFHHHHHHHHSNLTSDNYVKSSSTTSSEEGNSPTELNNCRRLLEKPPLVS